MLDWQFFSFSTWKIFCYFSSPPWFLSRDYFFDEPFYFFICFKHVPNCSLTHFIMTALKSLSDNSNISVISIFTCMNSLVKIQFEIFFLLCVTNDFQLKPGHLRYYVWGSGSYLNLVFYLASSYTTPAGKRGRAALLLPDMDRSSSCSSMNLHWFLLPNWPPLIASWLGKMEKWSGLLLLLLWSSPVL